MQLLEGVLFVWCDKPKPIQRWNTRLNIELIECMYEPSKDPPYGNNCSQQERHNVLWSIPIKFLSHLLEQCSNQTKWSYIFPSQEHCSHCPIWKECILGSMGDPSGKCTVTLIISSYILFKDCIPLFHFWGPGSCFNITIVVSTWWGNKFQTLWHGGAF
jgi:hypothetical protein